LPINSSQSAGKPVKVTGNIAENIEIIADDRTGEAICRTAVTGVIRSGDPVISKYQTDIIYKTRLVT
jgi:hypothetical protein